MSQILVVEDDVDIAALIAHYLEKAGHRVDRVASGSEVLPRLRRLPADLVILDLMLPGLDGLLVCQAMRADPSIAGIPIIMLTRAPATSTAFAGSSWAPTTTSPSRFNPEELTARITAVLRRSGSPRRRRDAVHDRRPINHRPRRPGHHHVLAAATARTAG